MTKQWLKYWNSPESERLDLFFVPTENTAQFILYQLNARKDNIVCEFGCGTGSLSSLIGKSVGRNVGVDFSEARATKNKKAEILINDSFNVELKDNCIDRTFCFSLFNFLTLEESIATLEEMFRVTKKDGFILIGDILKEEFEKIFYMKLRDQEVKCPELTFYSKKTFEKIVENIVTEDSLFTIYDTKIIDYPNNEASFNVLIWKK